MVCNLMKYRMDISLQWINAIIFIMINIYKSTTQEQIIQNFS